MACWQNLLALSREGFSAGGYTNPGWLPEMNCSDPAPSRPLSFVGFAAFHPTKGHLFLSTPPSPPTLLLSVLWLSF